MTRVTLLWLLVLSTAAVAQAGSLFEAGLADRTAYENWFGGLSGQFRAGAFYWVGQRSLPKPGKCNGGSDENWTYGCLEAKRRLDPTDYRRRLEPEYRKGWNSFGAPAVDQVASQSRPSSPAPAPNSASPGSVRAELAGRGYKNMSFTDMMVDYPSMPAGEKIAVTGFYQPTYGTEYLLPFPNSFNVAAILYLEDAPRSVRKIVLGCISRPGVRGCKGTFLVHTGCETTSSQGARPNIPCLVLDDVAPATLPD